MEITSPAGHQRAPLPRAELKTERLLVRPWEAVDAEQVFTACQDAEIQRWTTVPSPYRRQDAETYVRQISPNGFANGTDAAMGLFVRETGVLAGAVGLHFLKYDGPTRVEAEIGYWAAPATRGRGYVTEAVREVVRWAFDDLGFHRLVWQAYGGNVASWRVAEKAGFTMIGLQRSATVVRGELTDMWLADMLPGDPRP